MATTIDHDNIDDAVGKIALVSIEMDGLGPGQQALAAAEILSIDSKDSVYSMNCRMRKGEDFAINIKADNTMKLFDTWDEAFGSIQDMHSEVLAQQMGEGEAGDDVDANPD